MAATSADLSALTALVTRCGRARGIGRAPVQGLAAAGAEAR
jgi:hypothetical protein